MNHKILLNVGKIIGLILLICILILSISINIRVKDYIKYTNIVTEDGFNDVTMYVDDINMTDGVSSIEIEQMLNRYKIGQRTKEDGIIFDSMNIANTFNSWFGNHLDTIQEGENFTPAFQERVLWTYKQYINNVDWKYINQRNQNPIWGSYICVPTSMTILLNAFGMDVDVNKVVEFFGENESIRKYALSNYPKWVITYIKENKLFQISGIAVYGFNLYLDTFYKDFPYRFDVNYLPMFTIENYLDTTNFGIVLATYLPSLIKDGTRKNGHAIVLSRIVDDFDGRMKMSIINDPYGNPNLRYRGQEGMDGKNVVIRFELLQQAMKTESDDNNGIGRTDLYRVTLLKDKKL